MRYLSAQTIKKKFLAKRAPQSDEQFVAACGIENAAAIDALKIRKAIANLANVESNQIRAEDTFDGDLAHFDFWGSLDSIAVLLELEDCLGIRIPDCEAASISNPERKSGITVAEFVRGVLKVVRKVN
jgi:acyl carrier protein